MLTCSGPGMAGRQHCHTSSCSLSNSSTARQRTEASLVGACHGVPSGSLSSHGSISCWMRQSWSLGTHRHDASMNKSRMHRSSSMSEIAPSAWFTSWRTSVVACCASHIGTPSSSTTWQRWLHQLLRCLDHLPVYSHPASLA